MSCICKTLCWSLTCLATFVCLVVASSSIAQETTAEAAQESVEALFPTSPDAWLNSSPISSAMLKNKAAILYFFEEG